VDIEGRSVEDCPNLPVIRQRLAHALTAVGRGDVAVRLRAVRTDEESDEPGLTGSPTILIDGRDPMPEPHAVAALACRLYRTASGASGSPSVVQLTAALLARVVRTD
jgi:hypothetical protein